MNHPFHIPDYMVRAAGIPEAERCSSCFGEGVIHICHVTHGSTRRCFNCGGSGLRKDTHEGIMESIHRQIAEAKAKEQHGG